MCTRTLFLLKILSTHAGAVCDMNIRNVIVYILCHKRSAGDTHVLCMFVCLASSQAVYLTVYILCLLSLFSIVLETMFFCLKNAFVYSSLLSTGSILVETMFLFKECNFIFICLFAKYMLYCFGNDGLGFAALHLFSSLRRLKEREREREREG